MVARGLAATLAAAGFIALTGCSAGTADLEEQLAQVTADRDALQARIDAADARYDAVMANKAAVEEILADPDTYGDSGEDVADELARYATDTARMDDDVFGAVSMRDGWYYTLLADSPSQIDEVQTWTDPDGSSAGSLWVWHGTNAGGHPFALVGIAIDTYDDDGLITNEWVAYPYDDAYVREAINGAGTPTDITGVPWSEQDGE